MARLRRPRPLAALALLLGMAAAQAGCGTPSPVHHPPRRSAAPTPSATTSASPAALLACQAAAIGAQLGASDSATGHIVYAVTLTNQSARTCTLEGFPKLQMLASGQDVITNQTEGASPGGPSVNLTPALVTIAPGASASFVLQYVDMPDGTQECASASTLQISLPGGGGTITAAVDIAPCGGDIYVSPVQVGTSPP